MDRFMKMLRTSLMVVTTSLALASGAHAVGSDAIQPLDGVWVGKLLGQEASGCPPMLLSRFEEMSPTERDIKRLQFEQPFHPRSLHEEEGERLQWTQVAPNHWRGMMTEAGGADSGMVVQATIDFHVLSATRMQVKTAFHMDIPPQVATMLGDGSDACRFAFEGQMDWSGG